MIQCKFIYGFVGIVGFKRCCSSLFGTEKNLFYLKKFKKCFVTVYHDDKTKQIRTQSKHWWHLEWHGKRDVWFSHLKCINSISIGDIVILFIKLNKYLRKNICLHCGDFACCLLRRRVLIFVYVFCQHFVELNLPYYIIN